EYQQGGAFRRGSCGILCRQSTCRKGQGESQKSSDEGIEPEDRTPLCNSKDGGAQHRAEHGAQLLHRSYDSEWHAALIGWPKVGHQREGRGHQPSAAYALNHTTANEGREISG